MPQALEIRPPSPLPTSREIFLEAFREIPRFDLDDQQSVFAVIGFLDEFADVDTEFSKEFITRLKRGVTEFPDERIKARCLLGILNRELKWKFTHQQETFSQLIACIEDGVPIDKRNEWTIKTFETIASIDADFARTMAIKLCKQHPFYQKFELDLIIAEKEQKTNPPSAGKRASKYLSAWLYYKPKLGREKSIPREDLAVEYICDQFGRLIAKLGDIEIAKQITAELCNRKKESAYIAMAYLGQRLNSEPLGWKYLELADKALDRKDLSLDCYLELSQVYSQIDLAKSHKFQSIYESRWKQIPVCPGVIVDQLMKAIKRGDAKTFSRAVNFVTSSAHLVIQIGHSYARLQVDDLKKVLAQEITIDPGKLLELITQAKSETQKPSEKSTLQNFKLEVLADGASYLVDIQKPDLAYLFLLEAYKYAKESWSYSNHSWAQKARAWNLAKVASAAKKLEDNSQQRIGSLLPSNREI